MPLLLLAALAFGGVVRAPASVAPVAPAAAPRLAPRELALPSRALTAPRPLVTPAAAAAAYAAAAKLGEARSAPVIVAEAVAAAQGAVAEGTSSQAAQAGADLEAAITGARAPRRAELAGPVRSAAPAGARGPSRLKAGGRGPPPRKTAPPSPPSRKKWRLPLATAILVGANVAAYSMQLDLVEAGLKPEEVGAIFGWTPDAFLAALAEGDPITVVWRAANSLTSMFMHGGENHLYTNMLGLGIFGAALEASARRLSMTFVYLAAGAAASWLILTGVAGPTEGTWIGASGAVYGLMGAYLATLKRFLTPKSAFNGVKLALALQAALMAGGAATTWLVQGAGAGGVAHSVHVLGFVVGAALGYVFLRKIDSRST